jgi:hypothetical protein
MGTYGSASTAAFADYNIFTFVNPAMVKLYHSIVQSVKPFLNANEHYACQAWLNVFRAGEFIDWHKHWPAEDQCFHGYYCVNANNSTTSYRLNDQVYNVANHNGLVVFGRSAGDEHRSSPCTEPMPRVTIAFDIVPTSYLNIVQRDFKINHFIPI